MMNTLEIVSHFSNLSVSPMGSLNALNGLCPSKEFSIKYIIRAIKNIFEHNKPEYSHMINTILMDSCIQSFLKKDQSMHELMDMIYETLADNARTIHNSIQTLLDNGSIASFIVSEKRSNYCKNVREIGFLFKIMRENIYSKSIDKNPFFKGDQLFVILGDYIFFKEVVQQKYMYGGIEEYLFKILFLNTDHQHIDQLTCLYKLCVQYNAFSHSIKKNESNLSYQSFIREKLFDQKLDQVIASLVISREATLHYVVQIDQTIFRLARQLTHNNTPGNMNECDHMNDQQIRTMVSDLTDNIMMLQKIGDPVVFMFGYHEKLKKRLFEKTTNLKLEQSIAQTFKSHISPEIYVAINQSINDMMGAELVNDEFRQINITSTSGIYDENDMKTFDRSKSWFCILRQSAWEGLATEQTDGYKTLIAPKELAIYSNTFEKFYKQYFSKKYTSNSSRRINYLYDLCIVESDIQINQSQYIVHANFIQTSILMYCEKNPQGLTYADLSKLLNIQVTQFITQLNRLLLCGLIVYGKSSDDQTNRLRINHNFEQKSPDIILTEYQSMDSQPIDSQNLIIFLTTTPNQTLEQINQYFDADCTAQLKRLMDDNVVAYCEQQFTLTSDVSEFDLDEQMDDITIQPDAAQPDAAQPDAAQPDAAQPDAAQPDVAQPDAAQPDAAQPDAAQLDVAQLDADQSDADQSDAAQLDANDNSSYNHNQLNSGSLLGGGADYSDITDSDTDSDTNSDTEDS